MRVAKQVKVELAELKQAVEQLTLEKRGLEAKVVGLQGELQAQNSDLLNNLQESVREVE